MLVLASTSAYFLLFPKIFCINGTDVPEIRQLKDRYRGGDLDLDCIAGMGSLAEDLSIGYEGAAYCIEVGEADFTQG